MNRLYLSIFTAALTALGCSGCSRRIPSAAVVLVDPSASVTERARKDEFAAVATLIPKMQRGDLLIIIPITDNAAADIEGRVLQLRAPEHREAYDADLRQFRRSAETQYAEFASSLLAHPGQRTDILGALDIARQELEGMPASNQLVLIVLSDFLEDDGTYRFISDRRLASPDEAHELAIRLMDNHAISLRGIRISLGALESSDYRILDPHRRAAVDAFWVAYVGKLGGKPTICLDGPGKLSQLNGLASLQ